jgi:septal ring factor EnvC (AmiA/AmiB activator)
MAFKFFSIVKANAEVSRLETELVAAQEKLKAFETAEPENLAALQAELESVKGTLSKTESDLLAAKEAIKTIEAKDAEIATLKAASVELEKSVEARASEKALAITQAQGQVKPLKAEKGNAQQISRAEFNQLSADKQAAFCKAGGKITE